VAMSLCAKSGHDTAFASVAFAFAVSSLLARSMARIGLRPHAVARACRQNIAAVECGSAAAAALGA
jgi:hypothetical protein